MAEPEIKSDEEEFMELATSGDDAGEPKAPAARRRDAEEDVIDEDADDNKKYAKGEPVQYARMGPGFSPVGPTVSKLPTGVFRIIVTDSGYLFAPKKIVTDSLLRLPDSKSDMVIAEIDQFWKLKEVYKSFGFLHKRGFLLWGPPGSGKTSTTALVIAQMVDRGGTVFLMDVHPKNMAMALAEFRQVEPDRPAVVVLEDIDTIIQQYGEPEVLSLLDGEYSIDNVVFLATTNYPEELDGRIVNRPSRFDRIEKIGMPSVAARKLYLKSRGLTDKEVEEWVDLTEDFSIAHMKELIVGVKCLGQPLKEVSGRLRRMFQKVTSSGSKVGFGAKNEDD